MRRTRALTTDAKALPRVSAAGGWLLVAEFATVGAVAGAPGLWLYCNEAGDGALVPPLAATAELPRNVDIGGNDAALVTAEPNIGAAGSPFGDMAEYACKIISIKIIEWNKSLKKNYHFITFNRIELLFKKFGSFVWK